MCQFLVLFLQIVLLVSTTALLKDGLICKNIFLSFSICRYEGALVEVTQHYSCGDATVLGFMDLHSIQEDAFKNIAMTHLFLDHNRISELTKGSFRGLFNLMLHNLNNNSISLSEHIFAELKDFDICINTNTQQNQVDTERLVR